MNTRKAGPICGNPLNGLCERVCIEVKKVFDGCMSRFADLSFSAELTNFTPGTVAPFTFISARSTGTSTINNLTLTPVDNRRNRAEMDISFPVTVYYTDANGVAGTATTTITLHRDILLTLPADSVVPYTIEAITNLVSTIGSFTSPTTVTFQCCILQIVKVTVIVDILVPTYGYCEYPDCTEYAGEVCENLFNTPLFPTL